MANYRVTPTEELMLLVLDETSGGTRSFNTRHRQTAGSLSQKGLIGFRHSIHPGIILCWLTVKGTEKVRLINGT